MKSLQYVLFLLCLVFIQLEAKATHIVGGEMYYRHLGGDQYQVVVILYRDCNSTGAAYDPQISIGVFDNQNNLVQDIRVPFPGSNILPVKFANPCIVVPQNVCTEKATYQTVITLPPSAGGYTLAYQRCCRGPNVVNLSVPDDTGITLKVFVPGSGAGLHINSSPQFLNYPPLVICNNDELDFDHKAQDPDGDQLIYSLATPFHGGTSAAPMPQPPANPPFAPVTWSGGHSANAPLGPGSTLSIDPQTGRLKGKPNFTGLYVVGVQVEERRNGVTISLSVRDFLFVIISCEITMQALATPQPQLPTFDGYCNGLTVTFENQSYGATNYLWDFGISGTNQDTSTNTNPTFTFPVNGTYLVKLIAKKNNDCTDTAEVNVIVNLPVEVSFEATDSVCVVGNQIDFKGQATNPFGGTFSWDFGPFASVQSSTLVNVNDVNFSQAGSFPVTFSYIHPYCADDTTINILILDIPTASFDLPLNYECDGLNVNFINTSDQAVAFEWDFGDPAVTNDVSTLENPSYYYGTPGTYTITLIAGSGGLCMDTVSDQVLVYDNLVMSFTSADSLCIIDNTFDFIGTVSGPDITTYTWNFGPNANISSSNDTSVYDVQFATSGNHIVTLSGKYLHCEEVVAKNVFLYRVPEIDFTVEDGLQCVPFNAQFIDLSTSDAPIYYFWDLGNGQSSNAQNPKTTYITPGNYPVTLTIEIRKGCTDTLTLTKSELVNVRPNPVSRFTLNKEEIDICDNQVIFQDQSEGGIKYSYRLDDKGIVARNVPSTFPYNYQTSGYKLIEQIVENEFGCSDSSTQNLYVRPLTVYIPNTFTPDQDQFNPTFMARTDFELEEWNLRLYNRWGELVWESNDVNAQWDGTFKGEISPDGLYHYEVKLISCGNENKYQNWSGFVLLIR